MGLVVYTSYDEWYGRSRHAHSGQFRITFGQLSTVRLVRTKINRMETELKVKTDAGVRGGGRTAPSFALNYVSAANYLAKNNKIRVEHISYQISKTSVGKTVKCNYLISMSSTQTLPRPCEQ